jgi:hypothetical protein
MPGDDVRGSKSDPLVAADQLLERTDVASPGTFDQLRLIQ